MTSAAMRTGVGSQSGASSPDKDFLHSPSVRAVLPFINGGISGMVATTVIQPVDMVKVRLQLAGSTTTSGAKPTPFSIARDIVASGRVLDFYTGLSAGLFRQAIYTTARIGLFSTFLETLQHRAEEDNRTITFVERSGAGLMAGGLAAFVGNPADLALIRMQADGLKPLAERQYYKSVVHAIVSITRSEGITALWSGATPTVARAMALNLGQLTFFSEAKAQLKTHTQWSPLTQALTASGIAGLFSVIIGAPFDFAKTRLQRQQPGPDGKLLYNSIFDCLRKVAAEDGWGRFYRGFGTIYLRIAPHAMITLVLADYLGWVTR